MEQIMFWLILLIVFIGIEVATLGLTTIWFGGGALVAVLAAALRAPIVIQIVLFFLVSLVLLFFTRPVAVKYFNKDRIRTNVESLVGRQAIVISEINNLQSIGQVTVGGQEWSARSCDDKMNILPGAVVKILAINGVKLIVREEQPMPQMTPYDEKPHGQPAQGAQTTPDSEPQQPSKPEEQRREAQEPDQLAQQEVQQQEGPEAVKTEQTQEEPEIVKAEQGL